MNGAAGKWPVGTGAIGHETRRDVRRATRGVWTASTPTTAALLLLLLCLVLSGCGAAPRMLRPDERYPIDRAKVEYPAGFDLERYVINLTGPTALGFDADQNLIVAEGGVGGRDVRILGFRPDGSRFDVYPFGRRIPLLGRSAFAIYGPVGGMVVHNGWVYVSHRDVDDFGVITALDYKGNHRTIISGLPAQGEHGVTDLVIREDRLYFGVGTATNSGVVGADDFEIGWVKDHPLVHDIPYKTIKLLGRRFDTPNPNASPLFGIADIARVGPFQPFGVSNKTTIPGVFDGPIERPPKFNGGIFSIPLGGGELRVEAHGIRYPRGLAVKSSGLYSEVFFTNRGMDMRGSRPVKDDPDALLKLITDAWYGWPDFSANLLPIDPDSKLAKENPYQFQPPQEMVLPTGYPDVKFVIDQEPSKLIALKPDPTTLKGTFPSQSGAAGVVFVPPEGPFQKYDGSAIVALSGDRAPFATSGRKLVGSVGYKLVRVDFDRNNQVQDFIRNTQGGPASQLGNDPEQFERPIQVRFGPDGYLYVLDLGEMRMRDGREDVSAGTGKIYRLLPTRFPATQPAR